MAVKSRDFEVTKPGPLNICNTLGDSSNNSELVLSSVNGLKIVLSSERTVKVKCKKLKRGYTLSKHSVITYLYSEVREIPAFELKQSWFSITYS